MDYNAYTEALTRCQIQRMHQSLLEDSHVLTQSINVVNPYYSWLCLLTAGWSDVQRE